ncbi:hypothetical protein PR202_gb29899 [Eleusine coracana subsp. coracana]|uniref:Exoribonuclease phosphorolytic domain-containing protein n=1 Tax=Eleusine coracana subsp. coracana TaxID=191504 RepID=A0AAV5G1M0_ELECO|nr:hypothetical protein PR202_gb29899 [Eleusine coracana subsp. coracana]
MPRPCLDRTLLPARALPAVRFHHAAYSFESAVLPVSETTTTRSSVSLPAPRRSARGGRPPVALRVRGPQTRRNRGHHRHSPTGTDDDLRCGHGARETGQVQGGTELFYEGLKCSSDKDAANRSKLLLPVSIEANIAALASLSTFRRPECSVGGEDGQQITVHDPEVRNPIPLTIHHLPIAVTFAYFGEGNIVAVDPTYKEEAAMGAGMTATVNSNGDVCAIQKAGGEGVNSSVIMHCLRSASVKAADVTTKIRTAVIEVLNNTNSMTTLGGYALLKLSDS